MSFCAICTASPAPHREPLGSNEAMVSVCSKCTTEPARAFVSTRGYDIPEGMSSTEMKRRMAKVDPKMHGRDFDHSIAKPLTDGWILVRVSRRSGRGEPRDRRDALVTLQGKPWLAELRYLGAEGQWFLFERPGAKPAPSENPLAALEQWRVA